MCHESDLLKQPQDAVIIKTFYKYTYEQVSYILEHQYQAVCYKTAEGKSGRNTFPIFDLFKRKTLKSDFPYMTCQNWALTSKHGP